MPVNWVDGVTPVNAANLETMEADTAAKQAAAEKAQANGYAPLDATAKVPLVHLPPVSGVDYIGAWGAGTPYKRGDVVRYGSNDYLAVNDSTGIAPPAAATVPLGGVGIGTSLPASPFDGQEFVLTNSLTNPTYTWRFRYNAGSASVYKWEFIGGAPASSVIDAEEAVAAAGAWGDATTPGPDIALPRAGDYFMEWACQPSHNVTNQLAYVGPAPVGGSPLDVAATMLTTPGGFGWEHPLSSFRRLDGVGAITIRLRYQSGSAGCHFSHRKLSVTPVRVA